MLQHKAMSIYYTPSRMACAGLFGLVAAAFVLSGCGAREPRDDVWDQYDIRIKVPYNSPIPRSAAGYWQQNDPYSQQFPVDNDAYYMPPINDINSETYD